MLERPKQIDGFEIYTVHSSLLKKLNPHFLKKFLSLYQDKNIKRTHLFNNRYENIYLNEEHIEELSQFKEEACAYANVILGTNHVDMGYWFNYMEPGSITTAHRHDDDDELLSAAYYISVPENSGDIIIQTHSDPVKTTPGEGDFIFFKPNMVHEVTKNMSQQNRLSIGINFGQRHK